MSKHLHRRVLFKISMSLKIRECLSKVLLTAAGAVAVTQTSASGKMQEMCVIQEVKYERVKSPKLLTQAENLTSFLQLSAIKQHIFNN